jgi:predicted nucleic acid-binding protein
MTVVASADRPYADSSALLHVATALELDLRSFVTFDGRQQRLARAAGLKAITPSV